MVLLSPEEIVELNGNCIEVMGRPLTKGEAIKAGSRAQLKKVVEWGDERCPHPSTFDGQRLMKKRRCPECWQALKKEAGL